jgi:hypothetical protein
VLKPAEAAWHQPDPLLIGLLSQLVGSCDRQEIEAVCRRLTAKGYEIVGQTVFRSHRMPLKRNTLRRKPHP